VTHRLESRMREIRQSGSEGGVAGNGHPYPYPYLDRSISGDPFEVTGDTLSSDSFAKRPLSV